MEYVFIIFIIAASLAIGKLVIDNRMLKQQRLASEAFRIDETDRADFAVHRYDELARTYNKLVERFNQLKTAYLLEEGSKRRQMTYNGGQFTKDELIAIRSKMHPDRNSGKYTELSAKLNSMLGG